MRSASADLFSNGIISQKRGTTGNINGAVGSGSELGHFTSQGWNGSAYTANAAGIIHVAAESWNGTANGARMQFYTTPIGTTPNKYSAVLTDIGSFGITSNAILGFSSSSSDPTTFDSGLARSSANTVCVNQGGADCSTLGNLNVATLSTGSSAPSVTAGTGGVDAYGEGTAPSVCAAAGVDCIYASSTQHGFLASFNNGSYLPLPQGPASTTSGHFAIWNSTTGGLLADHAFALTDMATQAADTVVMNASGSTAAPTAVALPTCTSGADLYNTSTHSWSCVATGNGNGINAQTTNYTTVAGDAGKLVTFNGSSLTGTLLATPSSSYAVGIKNLNASALTVSRNGLTINGGTSDITLQQYQSTSCFSDGTNYFCDVPDVAGSGISLTPASNGVTIAATTGGAKPTHGRCHGWAWNWITGSYCGKGEWNRLQRNCRSALR